MATKNFLDLSGLTMYDELIKQYISEHAVEGGQSDWTQSDDTAPDYIKHKPNLGTASAKNVPTSGNASTTEVVMGDDTRLTDSRSANDVYSWAKASSKPSYTASEVGAIASASKGAANGVAELDANGLVPTSQLPSYVDDVLEYANKASFPITGEIGKICVDIATNLTYRWSGTAYVEISPSLALGTTSSTAYRGDYGNTAYTHATDSNRLTTAQSEGLYKIATTAEGHVKSVSAVIKSDITGLGIPAQDTTYSAATQSVDGLMSASDKTKLDGVATGATANIGTVTSVKVGTTSYSPSDGVVSLPAYPTTLPASDTTSTYSATGTAPVNGTAVASALTNQPQEKISSTEPTDQNTNDYWLLEYTP